VNKAGRERFERHRFQTPRTAIAGLIALGTWLLVLAALSAGLPKPNQPGPPPAPPMDMRMVVLDEPAAPESRAPQTPAAIPSQAAPTHERARSRTATQRAQPPVPAKPRPPTTPTTPAAAAPSAADASAARHDSQDERPEQAAADASRQSSAQHGATPAGSASADTAARAMSQPLPSLPDDLREQAYQTVATARFTIHADGSVEVELIQATPNPRLNQLLLDALRRWRFFPALREGRPVESTQDIRVHFNVS
jgi:protein TonB